MRAFVVCFAALSALIVARPSALMRQSQASAPVLAPDDAMRTFALPPGYRVELVASEPLVSDPILIDWDADGRLWVVEMPAYMTDIRATGELTPNGRVVVLEDQNRDGRMDRRTVFADGLVLPRALKVLDNGVLVGEPPNLWLMRDTDGDLEADTRTLVTDTFGRRDANVEHNANGLMWGLDNWIHTSEVDMFLRLRNGAFEVRKTLSRGQWGVSQDDAGRVYRNTNSSVLHVDAVPTPYYARTAGLIRTRGAYENLATTENGLNATYPSRPTPGVNRGYQFGVLREDGRLATFTGVAAPTVYRGDRLPAELAGNVFVAEPAGNLVGRIVLEPTEDGVTARRAYAEGEFLTSTDERFRPVYLSSAPDGTLYVVDMYRGIIQHKGYITEYLRDQILSRRLEQPIGLGRIYRIVHESTRRGPAPALTKATAATLVETLSHPNGWWRDTAQRLIVERGEQAAAASLERLALTGPWRTRLHALWTLEGLDALTEDVVVRALQASSATVRQSAVRLAERWLREGSTAMTAAVLARLDDPSTAVRRQVAASIGELPPAARVAPIAVMLERYGDDPVVLDASLSSVGDQALRVIAELGTREQATANRGAALTALVATATRAASEPTIQRVLGTIADAETPAWQRSALLAGMEVALLDAPMPGSPARRADGPSPAAPCTTCPGGRGGPGGAPAFPVAPASGTATATGGRGSDGPRLPLSARPSIADSGAALPADLAARTAAVLARVEWPGKPGAQTVAALTPAQQEMFDSGKEIYDGLCQACHQPDGRGLDKVAPPLVGSALVTGSVESLARVLLQGKEGPIGLMPPLGTTLSDEQIAASLTYVRRAWGHTASPVEPATIQKIREATAGRTRPWTSDELK